MSTLNESPVWVEDIYQLTEDTFVLGKEENVPGDGPSNTQAQQLANRTAYLKGVVDGIQAGELPYSSRAAAQAAINAGTIPDGALFSVRSENPYYWVEEFKNAGGLLVATGKRLTSDEYLKYNTSQLRTEITEQGKIINAVAEKTFTSHTASISVAGTYALTNFAQMRISQLKNPSTRTEPSVATVNVVQDNISFSELLLPGEFFNSEGKVTDYQVFTVNDRASQNIVIGENTSRFALFLSQSIMTGTDYYLVFDKNGSFTPVTQVLAASALSLSVSGYSAGTQSGFQLVIPNADITGAGYPLSQAGVLNYVVSAYGDYEFHVRTNTSSLISQNTNKLFNTGSVIVESSGVLNFVFDFYSPADTKTLTVIDTGYVKYSSTIKNNLNFDISGGLAEIRASFNPGEVHNQDCVILSDMSGNIIPCQWTPEPVVNYSTGEDMGFYADGSLRGGTFRFKTDLSAGALNAYRLLIYQDSRKKRTSPELTFTSSGASITVGEYAYHFDASNGYQLSSFTFNDETSVLKYSAYYAARLYTESGYDVSMATGYKSIVVSDYGDVYAEVTTTLEFHDVQVIIKTKLFFDGKVNIDTTMRTMVDIPENTIFGLTGRMDIYSPGADRNATLMTVFWTEQGTNRSAHLLYCHGHIHRDGDVYEARLPVWTFTAAPDANTNRLYGGWMYRTTTLPIAAIAAGTVFAHGYYVDLAQQQASASAANDMAHNTPTGILGLGVIEAASRKNLVSEIADYVYFRALYWDAFMEANNTTEDMNIYAAHLALLKYGNSNRYTFNEIYSNFIDYLQFRYGGVSSLGTAYTNNKLVLQFASRAVIPNILWLYQESLAQGDTDKQDALKTAISSLADVMVSTFNEKGFIPLNYGATADNSNSNATGLRILAVAIYMGMDLSGAYLATLSALENRLITVYTRTQNIMTESSSGVLAGNQYLHYSMYAYHDYFRACQLIRRPLALDMSTYVLTALASYGALREQQFCVSNSRKGSSLTYAYCIVVLNTLGGQSGQGACSMLLGHLKEQMEPDGSMPRPMDDWPPNLNTGAASPTPFELQALSEMLLERVYLL